TKTITIYKNSQPKTLNNFLYTITKNNTQPKILHHLKLIMKIKNFLSQKSQKLIKKI
ncbi:hypothetical protein GWA97_14110, partial [Flavobacterium sp. LaA7.5]|nr:hypothetical protein [Flavobacterium salilacus subsp. altitudinum]